MVVEETVRELKDKEAIRELRAQYCYHLDGGESDEWLDLFTEEATADFGPLGSFAGKEELKEYVETRDIPFSAHMMHNPIVEVTGDTATGRWTFEVPAVTDGKAVWLQGTYDEAYKRVEGDWKISSLTIKFNYVADYDDGWVREVIDDI